MDRHNLWLSFDSYKRRGFLKYELRKKLLKSTVKTQLIPYWRRYYASYELTKIPSIGSSAISSNRCVVSGRVWSVSKRTNYNRFILREEIYRSNIPGCSRASW